MCTTLCGIVRCPQILPGTLESAWVVRRQPASFSGLRTASMRGSGRRRRRTTARRGVRRRRQHQPEPPVEGASRPVRPRPAAERAQARATRVPPRSGRRAALRPAAVEVQTDVRVEHRDQTVEAALGHRPRERPDRPSCSCGGREAGAPGVTCRRARRRSCRTAAGVRPTTSATSPNGRSNTSCRRTRCAPQARAAPARPAARS